MPAPRTYQTEAIIIRKTKLGEADRVLTLYTPLLGKIEAKARGVRRPRSRLAGHLELLTYSLVSLARGRDLDVITGSQTIDGFITLRDDLWLTSCGLYAVELVNQFTEEALENQPLFRLLLETLQRLSGPGDKDLVLRYFEIQTLDLLGYRPELRQCTSCKHPLEPELNRFHPPSGGLLCPRCGLNEPSARAVSINTQKVLKFLQGNDYAAASRLKLDAELADELEKVMHHHIRYLLERELKSVAWLHSLRERAMPPGSALPMKTNGI